MNEKIRDKDIKRIINRAIDIQQSQRNDISSDDNTANLSDLKSIAAELGISDNNLKQALIEFENSDREKPALLNFQISNEVNEIIERSFKTEDLKYINTKLIHLTDIEGKGIISDLTLNWSSSKKASEAILRKLSIEIDSNNKNTSIIVKENLIDSAWGIYGGIIGGLGLGGGLGIGLGVGLSVIGSPLFVILFPLFMVGISIYLSKIIFGQITRRSKIRVRKIKERIKKYLLEIKEN